MSATTTNIISTSHHLPTTLCSQCSSMAHFQCIDHCREVFCGKCSVKHRTTVVKQMNDLTEKLKQCKIDPITTHNEIDENFLRASQQTIKRTRDTTNNLIAELQQREDSIIKTIENALEDRRKEREKRTDSALLTSEQAIDYTHLLHDCLNQDHLINEETMMNIQRRLDARNALGHSVSEIKHPVVEQGRFEPERLLHLRYAPRAQSSLSKTRSSHGTRVTVRLGTHKQFQIPLENTFSVGKHPTAVSLMDRYVETFFFRRTPGNSLILLSTTAIDIYNRGSGIESSIHLSKIFGTRKDKLLAGTWCELTQRLILNGNHRMYFYDLRGQGRTDIFPCQPEHGDPGNTQRFLACTHDGSIIYAYKSDLNEYTIEKLVHPPSFPVKDDKLRHEHTEHFLQAKHITKVNGRIAAMCNTHSRTAIVYRRFRSDKQLEHYLCFADQSLKLNNENEIRLPTDIKWITAITAYGNDGHYLLCDPRGQQLLFYHLTEGFLTRRFRIGAINACCLTDGKLVLWLQKQYASSPTGKLHFITAPHLGEPANVAKSFPLLEQK
ncbi:unnamed protein product [Adineta steineri]|uniref:Uncharacterized protein n=1 Tax=Adineta steineri TaxID=433720 RepID=A0A818SQZ0_9BILA|nr:unnamed protein product [Adineta steineri]CAF3671259.1 unnamed protein product [Adineta steineri]